MMRSKLLFGATTACLLPLAMTAKSRANTSPQCPRLQYYCPQYSDCLPLWAYCPGEPAKATDDKGPRLALTETNAPAPAVSANACRYDNNINLEASDDGVPQALFKAIEDPRDNDAWRYAEVLLCQRATNRGAYAIVSDSMGVANPPQEVIVNQTDDGYAIKLQLNTSATNGHPSATITSGNIDLIIYPAANGNPANMWVFDRNPDVFDGEPTLESSLQIAWGTWPQNSKQLRDSTPAHP